MEGGPVGRVAGLVMAGCSSRPMCCRHAGTQTEADKLAARVDAALTLNTLRKRITIMEQKLELCGEHCAVASELSKVLPSLAQLVAQKVRRPRISAEA